MWPQHEYKYPGIHCPSTNPEGVIIVTTVSFTFNTNVEEFASSLVSTTFQLFPNPNNPPNAYSGVMSGQQPIGVKPTCFHWKQR